MFEFKNKTVLITGGTSGIGLATAKAFHASGAQVIVTARTEESRALAQKEYGAYFDIIKTDVSSLSDIKMLKQHIQNKYPNIDVLFANAGTASFAPSELCDEAFFDKQFDTNVKGLYFTVTTLLPIMNQGSSVILNASVMSQKGVPGASIYSATKAAVRSFARSWTAEIPPAKVRFNVLSPGPTETPIYGKLGMSAEQTNQFAEMTKSQIPAQRFGQVDEMAQTVLFLASPHAGFICGADIVADGGLGQI